MHADSWLVALPDERDGRYPSGTNQQSLPPFDDI
jgi:hypothetical protein